MQNYDKPVDLSSLRVRLDRIYEEKLNKTI